MKSMRKSLSFKLTGEIIIFAIILIFLVFLYTTLGSKKESFSNLGASVDYRMGDGVPGDKWTVPGYDSTTTADMFKLLDGNKGGPVPLPEGELFMFYANKFSPECCSLPQQYSGSTGCACISRPQMQYLNERGGNRTLSTEF